MDDDTLPAEQLASYRAGAGEYERPYSHRPELRPSLTAVRDLVSVRLC